MKQPKWAFDIQNSVNSRLQDFFYEKCRAAAGVAPLSVELVEEVADLTMRGGKRFRPIALHAGFTAVSSDSNPSATTNISLALELLQTYLLIHDDWMDQDDTRRNAPSTHAKLRMVYSDPHLADSLAILVGDLASGFAWELFYRSLVHSKRMKEAFSVFASMHQDIILGQHLDLLGDSDVERMYQLKSGSYTVQGPIRLGAIMGDATQQQLDALDAYSRPLGIAFQIRDDLLSTFGESVQLGKPVGNDLRSGKNTLLIVEAKKLIRSYHSSILSQVLGNPNASDQQLYEATQLLISCGAKERVERRLKKLLEKARESLTGTMLLPEGISILNQLIDMFALRDR